MAIIEISFEKFVDIYVPEENNFAEDRSFDGYMFETYGKELEYVNEHKRSVWTLIEEDGEMFIVYGMRIVNRIGYFITKNLPLNPNVVVMLNSDEEVKDETLEEKYNRLKNELKEVENEYKKLKKKEFLEESLSAIKDEELLDAIRNFDPVEAYPQTDIFIYDGYRIWANSIVFKNWNREEKVVVLATDGDINIISVRHKVDVSIFFENKDGDELTDFHPELANLQYEPIILEEVEVVK